MKNMTAFIDNPHWGFTNYEETLCIILIAVEQNYISKYKLGCCNIIFNINEAIKLYQRDLSLNQMTEVYLNI